MLPKREIYWVIKLGVQPDKGGESPCTVCLSGVVPVLIPARKRKAGMHIEHRHKIKFLRQGNHAPYQPSVRCVGAQRTILVRTNQRGRKASEELVVVIQFSFSTRANIAEIKHQALRSADS